MSGKRKCRRAITFDLNRRQIIDDFGDDTIYNKIKKFMENKGFHRVQQSAYESNDPMYRNEALVILDELFESYPYLATHSKKFDITQIGNTHQYMLGRQRLITANDINNIPDINHNRHAVYFDLAKTDMPPDLQRIGYSYIKSFMEDNGFKHRQGSVYDSTNEITDKETVEIINRLFDEHDWLNDYCKELAITEITGPTYDYLAHRRKEDKHTPKKELQNDKQISDNNQKSKHNGKQDFGDTSSRDSVNDTKISKEIDEHSVISDEDIKKLESLKDSGYNKSAVEEFIMLGEMSENENDRSLLD